MTLRLLIILFLLPLCSAHAAGIVLIYPRVASESEAFEYDYGLDSTFVLGHVSPPAGELRINGHAVDVTSQGAFLAWLPLAKEPDLLEWNLRFRSINGDTAAVRFAYRYRTDQAKPDTFSGSFFPRVLRVTASNAHIRTAPEGSYFLFPQIGCKLIATGYRNGFFQVALSKGLAGAVEDRFVEMESDSQLPEARLHDGYCLGSIRGTTCVLGMNGIVPWSAEVLENGRVLQVTLFNTISAQNRIRYEHTDPFIRDVTWTQRPEGVILRFSGKRAVTRGFDIQYEDDSLRVFIGEQPQTKSGIKHKTIVVDPGHGGSALGAIGPLGTLEKDIVLRLSRFLVRELQRSGADVIPTREDDCELGLYDRMEIARRENADFFISLHANALPDGENPLVRHGSSTYYYQPHSRPAAEIIHRQLLNAGSLPDDGLWYANLAAVRPTEFPAVLVEAAYLIYPPEEQLLKSDEFVRKLAKGLARGIREYFDIQ